MAARRAKPFEWLTTGRIVAVLVLGALALAGRTWLAENPQHDPWAPLDLRQERGWATGTKLAALQSEIPACRATLARSDVAFTALDPVGEGACRREDRLTSGDLPLSPGSPQITCPVAAGLVMWLEQDVDRLARDIIGAPLQRVEQLGTYSCRRMYGASDAPWSEHATGNAIDISAFVLEDGQRVSVLADWNGDANEARFLRAVRDAACQSFGTVLSPDYNAAHADHFHLDQGRSPGFGACR